MKKIVPFLSLFLVFFGFGYGVYMPNTGDRIELGALKSQIRNLTTSNEDLWSFYYQIKVLKKNYEGDARLNYMLGGLFDDLWNQMNTKKIAAKAVSKQPKKDFLNKYLSGINKDIDVAPNCIGRYNTIDDIAASYNFPTSVIIATWYRETNCGYYLPSNGRGPFQITSKNYGTGQITEDIFIQSVIDFINFSKSKYSRYEKANSKSGFKINMSYTGVSFTGLVRHGALYNGLSGHTVYGDIKPLKPSYVFDNYGKDYTNSSKNGIISQFLKMLEWELNNKY